MSATTDLPNVQDGINYWESQPASLDGVLGKLLLIVFCICQSNIFI